ncbi:MAG: ChbG/HpnK family deacetylase [Alphaproteobacteria bacterium]|nr:MAG: ChbG/HpnK family deacetylase [Alphaproteobacteria bacterium]
MLVIINADDLGMNQKVNDAIFQLMSDRKITSATLLANGASLTEAIKELPYFPNCSFRVHLNATEFKPLTKNNELKTILDKNGCFRGYDLIRNMRIGPPLSHAIYIEFCAQIEKLYSLGVKISHIDSHHNIITIPRFFPILKRIQKRYGLKKVRISLNMYHCNHKTSLILLTKKRIFNFMQRHYYATKTTSIFTVLFTFYEKGKLNKLKKYRSCEIVVHPGAVNSNDEMALLMSPWIKDLPFDIKLINYNEL